MPLYPFVHYGKVPAEPPRFDSWIQSRGTPGAWGWLDLDEENVQRWLSEARELGIARPLASRDEDLLDRLRLADDQIEAMVRHPQLTFATVAEYANLVAPDTERTRAIPADELDTVLPFGLLGDALQKGCKRVEGLLLTCLLYTSDAADE